MENFQMLTKKLIGQCNYIRAFSLTVQAFCELKSKSHQKVLKVILNVVLCFGIYSLYQYREQRGKMNETREENNSKSDADNMEFFFESEHLDLRGNADYTNVLRPIAILQAQRIQATKDIEKVAMAEKSAFDNHEEFVRKLVAQEDVGMPGTMTVVKLPKVDFAKHNVTFPELQKIVINDASNSADLVVRGRVFGQSKPETFNQMLLQDRKYVGLVADLMPNIRLMQAFGHFLFNYTSGPLFFRKVYSTIHLILILAQFIMILVNVALNTNEVNELSANTITALFFTHCITKFIYFAINSKNFYRTLNIWNQSNSHPLFAESDARYHGIALAKMRKLLVLVMITTVLSVVAWTTITFFGESTKFVFNKATNESETVEVPRLPIKSFYPWNAMQGMPYLISFGFQVYYLLFSLCQSNLSDVLFCSWLIFACEQLQHLKGIMKPLMELSASLDTYRPNTAALFRTLSASSKSELINNEEKEPTEINITGIYSSKADWGVQYRAPSTLQNFGQNGTNGNNPNGLTKKQEMMVRSAIKYWVERHKHVVRLVAAIGDTYGAALLLHMLTSTIKLTLLAYQATKITGVNVYALSVIGYLCYSLAQVFHFCIFGNRLIEESSSVMEAAYSCHWYDGSEEAKTFVQIVCQQCQKAMSISGAKFFTVSLDLFASVLGAVVTYFMVLVQLK